jgi:F0F1-type ATP synthase assembly protein I
MAGYVLGNYLEKRFSLPPYVSIALIIIGFIASLKETIRIIKIALRTQEGH